MNPPQQRKSEPLSELKETDMSFSDLRIPAAFFRVFFSLESKPFSGEHLSWRMLLREHVLVLFAQAEADIYKAKSGLHLCYW